MTKEIREAIDKLSTYIREALDRLSTYEAKHEQEAKQKPWRALGGIREALDKLPTYEAKHEQEAKQKHEQATMEQGGEGFDGGPGAGAHRRSFGANWKAKWKANWKASSTPKYIKITSGAKVGYVCRVIGWRFDTTKPCDGPSPVVRDYNGNSWTMENDEWDIALPEYVKITNGNSDGFITVGRAYRILNWDGPMPIIRDDNGNSWTLKNEGWCGWPS